MLTRRALLSSLAGVALCAIVARAADGPTADKSKLYLFNIPAQSLSAALIAYAGIVNSQIIYDSKLARSLRSQRVVGLFTADTALRLLIAGTDFTIVTTGQDVALVPLAEIRAGHWPGENADGETTLVLDTLYVALPPGAEQRPDFTDYGQLVRAQIRRALTDSPTTARRIYNARFDIWIDLKGAVGQAKLTRASGTGALDVELQRVIEQVAVDRPPPKGMPQPIHITVIGI